MSNVGDLENRSRGKDVFKVFKGFLLELGPDPGFSFAGKRLRGATMLEKSGMNFL